MLEDLPDGRGIVDQGDHLSWSCAPGANQDVQLEDPPHQLGPEEIAMRRKGVFDSPGEQVEVGSGTICALRLEFGASTP